MEGDSDMEGAPLLDIGTHIPVRLDRKQLLPPQAAHRQRLRKRTVGPQAAAIATAVGHAGTTGGGGLCWPPRARARRGPRPARANLRPHREVSLRRHVYAVVSGKSRSTLASIVYKYLLVLIISINLGMFVASTEGNTGDRFATEFQWVEGITCVLYLVDYALKLWSIVEAKDHHDPVWGRVHYVFSFHGLVDAVSTFPFFIQLFASLGNVNLALPSTAWLRILGLFRILKTERFVGAFHSVARVIYSNRDVLIVGLVVCAVLLMGTSTLLYFAHRGKGSQDSTADFSSIPATMYLSALMLTGQGIPDGNLSLPLKFVVVLTAIFSVAVFTVPAAMLAWGFEAEAERLQEKRRKGLSRRLKAEREGLLFIESSSSSDYDILSDSADSLSEDGDGDGSGGGSRSSKPGSAELQRPAGLVAAPFHVGMDCPQCGHHLTFQLTAT